MSNIWGVLLQTLTVSLVAMLILIIKRIFADKLSPRWQYGIWIILVIRIFVPADITKANILPINYWIETLKSIIEEHFDSAYSKENLIISIKSIVPSIPSMPVSITDWIFIIYIAGVIISLLWYLITYIKLRIILRNCSSVNESVQNQIDYICETYNLKPCRAVNVKGLTSAFICGVISPVLAIPEGKHTFNKVILHELLHYKYFDILQNFGWCILRSLHWFNPFMQYIFNVISNDMESLCDQRVLERLDGEERREYGQILLHMANDKYSRTPGSSSISNGGKNISKRILAITRFKTFPKGMMVVSICIVIVVLSSVLICSASTVDNSKYFPETEEEMEDALILARLNRCTTVGGAIDTYAKGILLENGLYIATVSTTSKTEKLKEEMDNNYFLSKDFELGDLSVSLNNDFGYEVYNIVQNKDGSFNAVLVFNQYDEDEDISEKFVFVPIHIWEDNGWVVEVSDEIICKELNSDEIDLCCDELPYMLEGSVTGESGNVIIDVCMISYIYNNTSNTDLDLLFSDDVFYDYTFDYSLNLDAEIYSISTAEYVEYNCSDACLGYLPQNTIGIKTIITKEKGQSLDFDSISDNVSSNEYFQSSSATEYISNNTNYTVSDRNLFYDSNEISTSTNSINYYLKNEFAEEYNFQIIWDGEVMEELTIDGGDLNGI